MNNYNDFELKDFLENPEFQDWVYQGNSDHYWRTYLENNPVQLEKAEQAKNILLSVRGDLDSISEQEVKFRVTQLLDSISEKDNNKRNSWWKGEWLRAAAVLLLASGLGAYCWGKFVSEPQPYYAMLRELNGEQMIEVINDQDKIKLVNLPDGSSVILKEGARISYPRVFEAKKREVYLLGEAFFEVEKNADQPFYVYAEKMVTKVTGTSFSIQANKGDAEVKLVVKTGVVEVSAFDHESAANSKNEKLVLNPNQLVTMSRKSLGLTTRKVENAILINLPIESLDFSFKRMPLKEVFETLEIAYGVRITFDKDITERCTITAKLGDEPVYEKLEMICSVVNATYNIKNNHVFVHSYGCGNQ